MEDLRLGSNYVYLQYVYFRFFPALYFLSIRDTFKESRKGQVNSCRRKAAGKPTLKVNNKETSTGCET